MTGLGSAFDDTAFRKHFVRKNRFEGYLSAIPCYAIVTHDAALLGLAKLVPGM